MIKNVKTNYNFKNFRIKTLNQHVCIAMKLILLTVISIYMYLPTPQFGQDMT